METSTNDRLEAAARRFRRADSRTADRITSEVADTLAPLITSTASNYARIYARDGVEYDDLEQAGRLAVWDALLKYDPAKPASFRTFVHIKIVGGIQHETRRLRRGGRRVSTIPFGDAIDAIDGIDLDCHQAFAVDQAENIDRQIVLAAALDKLPTGTRDLLVRHYLLGVDAQTIADEMQCSTQNVYVKMRRSLALLKASLGENAPDLLLH